MLEFLRDPLWQFVGVTLAVAAIVLSFVFFGLQHQRKQLGYRILTDTLLFTVSEEVQGKLKVFLDGKLVSEGRIVVIEIFNGGNVPILEKDFVRPLTCKFGADAQVLNAEVIETRPDNLDVLVAPTPSEVVPGKVVMNPILLNGGDYIKLRVLIARSSDEVRVEARIVGISNVKRIMATGHAPIATVLTLGIALMLVGLPSYAAGARRVGSALLMVGYIAAFISIISSHVARRLFAATVRRILPLRQVSVRVRRARAAEEVSSRSQVAAMIKPNPADPSTYRVLKEEKVGIEVISFGVAPLVKASLDGQTLLPPPPFKFTVTQPPGGLHVVVVECDFPPEPPAEARHEIYVSGDGGGGRFYVTTIRPTDPIKRGG